MDHWTKIIWMSEKENKTEHDLLNIFKDDE